MATSIAFHHPVSTPVQSTSQKMPNASYTFTVSGGTTAAIVYQDAYLQVPFTSLLLNNFGDFRIGTTNVVYADTAGNFPPIYLDPTVIYRVVLANSQGVVQYTVDPYVPPLPFTGNNNFNINPITGEVVIGTYNSPSGSTTLEVLKNSGSVSIAIPGNSSTPGVPLVQFLNSLITGTQTATFTATNKPGGAGTAPSLWWPILGDGGQTYYIPLWL
jgi:hypothetical protein